MSAIAAICIVGPVVWMRRVNKPYYILASKDNKVKVWREGSEGKPFFEGKKDQLRINVGYAYKGDEVRRVVELTFFNKEGRYKNESVYNVSGREGEIAEKFAESKGLFYNY